MAELTINEELIDKDIKDGFVSIKKSKGTLKEEIEVPEETIFSDYADILAGKKTLIADTIIEKDGSIDSPYTFEKLIEGIKTISGGSEPEQDALGKITSVSYRTPTKLEKNENTYIAELTPGPPLILDGKINLNSKKSLSNMTKRNFENPFLFKITYQIDNGLSILNFFGVDTSLIIADGQEHSIYFLDIKDNTSSNKISALTNFLKSSSDTWGNYAPSLEFINDNDSTPLINISYGSLLKGKIILKINIEE